MKSLNYYFKKALKEKWAIPQFNFSNLETLKAIVEVAKDLKSPVIVGTSEKESEFLGLDQAVNLIKTYRKQLGLPIFLNLDHGKSFSYCKMAIDRGYDTCHFDGSALAFEKNLELSKRLVFYAHQRKVLIEGEIEEIGSKNLTDPEKAAFFCRKTKIHRLAVNIGNIHAGKGKINFYLLREIKKKVAGTFLVLHGGSGISSEEVRESINLGITKINLNTELRKVFTNTLYELLRENRKEYIPYKYMSFVVEKLKKTIEEKINLFGSINKI
jgi:ketose-bisphosphate aldolase